MDDNKSKALAAALSQIEKQFGKGSIMRLGESDVGKDIEVVSTGSLGSGHRAGRGRFAARSRDRNLRSGILRQNHADPASHRRNAKDWAAPPPSSTRNMRSIRSMRKKLGVNVDDLLISQPDNGEQALEIVDMLVRSGAVDIVVIDSVAALTPKAEIEGEMGDAQMGLHARLMSQALRKLTANIKRSNTMVIFINQIRMKIGVMFGNPETTTGGNALKFYASVRLDIRRTGAIKKGDEVIGNETRVKVVKNKVAPPFKRGRIRHPVRRRHLARRRNHRAGRAAQVRREIRRLVCLQRREDRPGQGQCARIPERASRHRRRNRKQGARSGRRGRIGCK